MTRSRTFELTTLAVAHLRAGNRDCALTAGREAVAAATTVRSVRILDRLQPLEAEAGLHAQHDDGLKDLTHAGAALRAS